MERILEATCSLGLIVYSLDSANASMVDKYDRRDASKGSHEFARNFASAAENLLAILESLNSSSHNPMGDLPPEFECTAEACATDVENIRRDMAKGVNAASFHLALNIPKLRKWTSTLQSYDELLSPHMKSLAG